MNETTTDTTEPEVKNPAALLAKNRELLGKLAAAQAELATAQAALEGEKATHATTAAALHSLRLDGPLQKVLADMSPSPKLLLNVIKEFAKFDLDAEGKPAIMALDGQPLTYEIKNLKSGTTEKVHVQFDHVSMIHWINDAFPQGDPNGPGVLIHKAQGTGAPGASYTSRPPSSKPAAAPAPAARPEFGLR